jgi:hypothetical protein
VTSPWNGTYVYVGKKYTLKASASDNVAVAKVEFYVNGVLKCTDTTANYTCSWTTPAGRGIKYSIQSKAYDAAGNAGVSAIITVTSK